VDAKIVESRGSTARSLEDHPRVSRFQDRERAEGTFKLSEKTTELNAAQTFLTRADAVSEAEAVGMIENLNTLISSVSGAVSVAWVLKTDARVEHSSLSIICLYLFDIWTFSDAFARWHSSVHSTD